MRSSLGFEEVRQSIEKELHRCMGFSSAAFDTTPTASITVAQLQCTIQKVVVLQTIYYIAREAVPQIDEEGCDIYFVVSDELARRWVGCKPAGFWIMHPNLLPKAREIVTENGLQFREWQYDCID